MTIRIGGCGFHFGTSGSDPQNGSCRGWGVLELFFLERPRKFVNGKWVVSPMNPSFISRL